MLRRKHSATRQNASVYGKRNFDQYLAAIQRLKRWSYSHSLGAADDTNVNAVTNLQTVYIYGLPFSLSDKAL